MSQPSVILAAIGRDGQPHISAAIDTAKSDIRDELREVYDTAHRLSRLAGLSPSRDVAHDFMEHGATDQSGGPHMGSVWIVSEALWAHHGAIPGHLVRESQVAQYDKIAAPVGRLAARLATRKPIRNGMCGLVLRSKDPSYVNVEVSIGMQVDDQPGIWKPPVDHRVGRVLFAIGLACWLREGSAFFRASDHQAVIYNGSSYVRSPGSATLVAAERRTIARTMMKEVQPTLEWLREGGLEEEARGLVDAVGDLS